MGMKKIAEKRAELDKRQNALNAFVQAAKSLGEAIEKVQKLGEEAERTKQAMYEKKAKMLPVINKLDTLGLKEFEGYKSNLVAICTNKDFAGQLLPMASLHKIVDGSRNEHREMLNAWIEKQAAAMPKEFKKGMVFKDYTLDHVVELTSDVKRATNINLSGDDALWFDLNWTDMKSGKEGKSNMSKGMMLKNKLKFIRM